MKQTKPISINFFRAETKTNGSGWMTKDDWEKTTKILVDQGAMKQSIDVSKAFTDKYLPGAKPLKR